MIILVKKFTNWIIIILFLITTSILDMITIPIMTIIQIMIITSVTSIYKKVLWKVLALHIH
jgi:hypothetical protein